MKTIEELEEEIWKRYGSFELSHDKNKDIVANILKFILDERKEYAREAIKADRDKVANYVVYQNTLHNHEGEIIDTKVKETIRNAPEIELL